LALNNNPKKRRIIHQHKEEEEILDLAVSIYTFLVYSRIVSFLGLRSQKFFQRLLDSRNISFLADICNFTIFLTEKEKKKSRP